MDITYYDTDLPVALNELASTLLSYAGGIALLFLVFGGVYYVSSNSNPAMHKRAKGIVAAALLGLIIIVLSYSMIVLIERIAT